MNTNFNVIGLTRLGIKAKSTASEAGALYHSANGAAAMASARSGVTSIVQNESGLADYFHCVMHCLNLSASAALKVSATPNAENVARKVVKNVLRPVRRKQRC